MTLFGRHWISGIDCNNGWTLQFNHLDAHRIGLRRSARTVSGHGAQGVRARRDIGPREHEVWTIRRGAERWYECAKPNAGGALEEFDLYVEAVLPIHGVGHQPNICRTHNYLAVLRVDEPDGGRLVRQVS